MRVAIAPRHRRWATFLAVVFAVAAALYVVPGTTSGAQSHGANNLKVSWVANASKLELIAEGFRPRSAADVKIADLPPTTARADRTGAIHLQVPVDIAAAGKPGASVIIYGKGPTGAARTLFAAVPPVASGRGPLDLLPWSIGGFVLVMVIAALVGRLWHRRALALRAAAGGPVVARGPAAAGQPPARFADRTRRRRR